MNCGMVFFFNEMYRRFDDGNANNVPFLSSIFQCIELIARNSHNKNRIPSNSCTLQGEVEEEVTKDTKTRRETYVNR